MSDFLYLYRGGDSNRTPEDMQKSMHKWMAWFEDLGASGKLKAGGEPLDRTGKVVTKRTTVIDGPYAEVKDLVGGFSIVTAKDIDEAASLASGCPIFDIGGFVEVRPILQMSM
ncbi:MAG: transcription initiation protein [Gemmatimonadaceae bacterium]|nr:transcription initiation protein [Gemmatimonadaceae bacterium]